MRKLLLSVVATGMLLVANSAARADFVLGVTTQPDPNFKFGLRVMGVTDPGAAKDMNIAVGDLLFNLNGQSLRSNSDLFNGLQASGGNITLSIQRGSATFTGIQATLTDTGVAAASRRTPVENPPKSARVSRASNIRTVKPSADHPTPKK